MARPSRFIALDIRLACLNLAPMGINEILFIAASAALWRLGGSVDTRFRRFGVPLVLFLYILISGAELWRATSSAALLVLTTRLPITLSGSNVLKNWLWLPTLGYLIGLSALPLVYPSGFIYAGVSSLIFSFLFLGAEVYRVKVGLDIWELAEIGFGLSYAVLICAII